MKTRSWWLCACVKAIVAVAFLSGCGETPPVEVGLEWKVEAADRAPFVFVAPMADGGCLATTHTDVRLIDTAGAAELVFEGSFGPPRTRPVLNPTGETFGIFHGRGLTVFDRGGGELFEVPVEPLDYVRLIPGTKGVFVPEVERHGIEEGAVVAASVLDAGGSVEASFRTPGLEISRVTRNHLVYATRSELVKTTLTGEQVWRVAAELGGFELSADGQRIIANSSVDTRVVLHFLEAEEVGRTSLRETVWNLALSPSGSYSLATTKTRAVLFSEGKPKSDIQLRVEYANSAAVSNRGEVLVGGQDAKHGSHVYLFDADGNRLWTERFETDAQAWRPEVRFFPDGDRFVVRSKTGITSYRIERRP
jgi:hypothetical protein